jgi:hypothetical protein
MVLANALWYDSGSVLKEKGTVSPCMYAHNTHGDTRYRDSQVSLRDDKSRDYMIKQVTGTYQEKGVECIII